MYSLSEGSKGINERPKHFVTVITGASQCLSRLLASGRDGAEDLSYPLSSGSESLRSVRVQGCSRSSRGDSLFPSFSLIQFLGWGARWYCLPWDDHLPNLAHHQVPGSEILSQTHPEATRRAPGTARLTHGVACRHARARVPEVNLAGVPFL